MRGRSTDQRALNKLKSLAAQYCCISTKRDFKIVAEHCRKVQLIRSLRRPQPLPAPNAAGHCHAVQMFTCTQ